MDHLAEKPGALNPAGRTQCSGDRHHHDYHEPATDLGYLLHKHPDRWQAFEVSVGTAYVCYPEAAVDRCTAR